MPVFLYNRNLRTISACLMILCIHVFLKLVLLVVKILRLLSMEGKQYYNRLRITKQSVNFIDCIFLLLHFNVMSLRPYVRVESGGQIVC